MNRLRGFTLVELIVVIATIGILATITVIGLTRYQADTRDARRASSVSVISEALEKYYDQNGEYPSCSAITAAATTVTSATLKGVSNTSLEAPQAPNGETNSLKCTSTLTTTGTDFFQYVGDGSNACTGSGSCLQYSIKYKDEATNTIKTQTSRRSTSTSTIGAPLLSINDIDFDNVTLNWSEGDNANSYLVQSATEPTFSSSSLYTFDSTATTQTVTGLTTATQYYFRVRVYNGTGDGTWSNIVTATTLNISKPVCSSVANSNTQITTTWNTVATATSYSYQYSTSSNMSSPIVTTGISATNKVLTGLTTGVRYYVQVMAVNSSFNSGWSIVCPVTTVVPAPSCLSATVTSSTEIRIDWCMVGVATSYQAIWSTTADYSSNVSSITDLAGPTFYLTGLAQGATYYVSVYAIANGTTSAASPQASATTTVDTPSTPSATAYTPNAVRAYSAGDWVAFTETPHSGNWYYSYGKGTGSCPAGTYKLFSFRAQYSSPTTLYGWTSFSTDSTRFMIEPNSPYKVKFYVRMRCDGPNAVSAISGTDTACASSSASNVTCF